MQLGSTIAKIRKQKGISQYLFAQQIEVTQTYLSLIENNKRNPNILKLEKICVELDIPLPILFFRSMEENDVPEPKRKIFAELSPFVNSFIDNLFVKS